MIENSEIQHDVEGAETGRRHVGELDALEARVGRVYCGLQQLRLLDELRTGIEADDLGRAEERALDRPEAGVAGDVEDAPARQRPARGCDEGGHEVGEALQGMIQGARRGAATIADVDADARIEAKGVVPLGKRVEPLLQGGCGPAVAADGQRPDGWDGRRAGVAGRVPEGPQGAAPAQHRLRATQCALQPARHRRLHSRRRGR